MKIKLEAATRLRGSLRVPIALLRKAAPNIVEQVYDMIKENNPGDTPKEIEDSIEVDISLFSDSDSQLSVDFPKEAQALEKLLSRKTGQAIRKLKAAKTKVAPELAIKIAADDITKLRKVDVFRVLETYVANAPAIAAYIIKNRPELKDEVLDVLDELGTSL